MLLASECYRLGVNSTALLQQHWKITDR